MSQTELYGLSGTFIFFCSMMAYFWHSKKIEDLQKEASAKAAELNQALKHNSGQISVLEKQVQSLSQEKNKALQQYHATDTLLTAAKQAKMQQDSSHKQQVEILQSSIKSLEKKMNLAIGNYQAERRRNLITEKAHIQESLNQLSVLEKNLVASQQAFTKPSA